jgi:tetratricopeptide (TPR) repeat protein
MTQGNTTDRVARTGSRFQRRHLILAAAGLLVVLWSLAGVRPLSRETFGVLDGPLLGGSAMQVSGRWTLAPPGLLRLTLYPRRGVELPLPEAKRAMLPAADGSRFGLRGWITLRVRPESWRLLHDASAGRGLEGVLVDAVREAADALGPGSERGLITPTTARALELRLGETLSARGVDLRRVELEAIDFLTLGEGETVGASAAKVLIIGLDGLDWEILDPLLEQGRLPNMKRLIDGGARAKLLSINPLLSPVVWTTVATGVEPRRHGILDFLVEDPATGEQQPVTAAQRQVPTFWELLSRRGVEVGVVGWWATWPADPVRGYLVSDRLAYQLFGYRADPADAQGKTWPPDLYPEIRSLITPPESVEWARVEPFLKGPRRSEGDFSTEEAKLLEEFRTLLASGETYLAIAEELRRRFKPQLEVVYFEGTDTVGHLFMPYRPPALPGVDPQRIESFSAMVDRYYELADRFVGQLLQDRGDDWTVMLLSDHGFASDATRPRSTDSRIGHGAAADWHRRFGVLVLGGAGVRSGTRIEEASIFDIAPTVLALFGEPIPRSWPGRVLARALTPELLAANPVRFRSDDPERRDSRAETLHDPAAADLLAKLESLGYISGGSAGGSDSATMRNNAGVALLAEGRYAEAANEFRAGLQANPESPMLMVNLALALRLQGGVEEPERLLRLALGYPQSLRMAGHLLAQMRLDAGDLDEAQSLARRILEVEPDAADVRNLLGLALEKKGEIDAARREYEQAAAWDPHAALARNNLGNLAKQSGRLDDAESWYLRAIESDPYFMGAYNNLALVYQARGELDRAIDLYGRALGKAPSNAVVLNNLGSLYYASGEIEEARRMWSRSAAADPSYPSPLNNLASLEMNDQRLVEAERLLRRALELDPDYGDARMNLALILRSRQDLEAATEQYELATQDPRTGANSWLHWGLFELERGHNDRAIELLRTALGITPDAINVLNPLGEAYYRSGRAGDALTLWRRSIQLEPDQPQLEQAIDRLTGGSG